MPELAAAPLAYLSKAVKDVAARRYSSHARACKLRSGCRRRGYRVDAVELQYVFCTGSIECLACCNFSPAWELKHSGIGYCGPFFQDASAIQIH